MSDREGAVARARTAKRTLAEWEEKFRAARQSKDRESEIEALLGMADRLYARGDLGPAHMHYKLAEEVIGSTGLRSERMPEALGGIARVQTGRGRRDEADASYQKAINAADTPIRRARWL